jgi:glutathione synthase/RimK-type ligase-like ATP-grasp enzyme
VRPRIALATYANAPSLAPDDQLLLPALSAAGIDAEPAVWSDESVIWETFDGVVIRSCWDYHLRLDEFQEWLDRLDASRLPVWNAPSLVTWNWNKRYLADLAARGVPTIETRIVPRGDVAGLLEAAESWDRFVVKPAVSASGFETHALRRPRTNADRETLERVLSLGDALVQPFVAEVPRDGELSFVFIDGALSHAAIKRASGDEFRVQVEHGGSVAPIDADAAIAEQAKAVLAALPEVPLYARVDGVAIDGSFLLMELELIEPNLFLELRPEAPALFAEALARRLRDA